MNTPKFLLVFFKTLSQTTDYQPFYWQYFFNRAALHGQKKGAKSNLRPLGRRESEF